MSPSRLGGRLCPWALLQLLRPTVLPGEPQLRWILALSPPGRGTLLQRLSKPARQPTPRGGGSAPESGAARAPPVRQGAEAHRGDRGVPCFARHSLRLAREQLTLYPLEKRAPRREGVGGCAVSLAVSPLETPAKRCSSSRRMNSVSAPSPVTRLRAQAPAAPRAVAFPSPRIESCRRQMGQ